MSRSASRDAPPPTTSKHSSSSAPPPLSTGALDSEPTSRRPSFVCSRSTLLLILGGQCLSLLLTGTAVFSELLAESGVRLPTTQSFLAYLLLSLFLVPHYLAYRSRQEQYQRALNERLLPAAALVPVDSSSSASETTTTASSSLPLSPPILSDAAADTSLPTFLSIPWYYYLLLALCDVEGNYCLVTAFQYTNITSIQLLDCFTIPLIMLISYCFLRVRYTALHYTAALVCLSGMGLLILSDQLRQLREQDSPAARDQLIGDLLVLLGCACYAVSNLGQERIVKQNHRIEWLAMLGLFGTLLSLVQMLATERAALAALVLTPRVVGYTLGFVACLYALYLSVPLLLARSGALFFNLSILTSDFWSVLFGVVLFHIRLHPLYFVAFVLIIAGLLLYEWAASGRGWNELCCWKGGARLSEEQNETESASSKHSGEG